MKFEKEWVEAYPKYNWLLKDFRTALGVGEMSFELCSVRNLTKIRDYMMTVKSANSVRTYCAVLKAFLAQFVDSDVLPCGERYKNALKVAKQPSEQIVLTEEEIHAIENYNPCSKGESDIKAQFLCEYYCMARMSDIMAMTEENIDFENGLIRYVSIKTKKKAVVPLHRNFLYYFQRRGKEHTRAFYNTAIKKICRKCGINQPVKAFYHGKEQTRPKYEMVGSHTARRSGATHLAAHGAPIVAIAQMMNHGTNIRQTQGYIYQTELNLSEETMSFFK